MSKLSAPLKALINAPFARPDVTPAPKGIRAVYQAIAKDAAARDVAKPCWLTIATATTMTLNSPASLTTLYDVATSSPSAPEAAEKESLHTAELMRETGLKCISFNGIPRSINNLGAFRSSLPSHIAAALTKTPTRAPTPHNIAAISARGQTLWNDIYRPFDAKLVAKLADSHPDLPVHILHSHYGALLSDPEPTLGEEARPRAGRVLTPLIAISCLRAQTGVGPQVLSHVFGLRKAFDAEAKPSAETALPGARWLASDEGSVWVLETVDRIVKEFGEESGTTFAPGVGAKL